jgi:MFS family permease
MGTTYSLRRIIIGSTLCTLIQWYDFFIFGSLATVMSELFFPKGDRDLALLETLAIFAAGFVARPFGAVVFGRIGDRIGRKHAAVVTLSIMGFSTAAIGFLPTYEKVGMAAPLALIFLRVLQGLALGGEYGGVAVYVAEHVPDEKRGHYTGYVQIAATLGLFVALAVIASVRGAMPERDFRDWGWRYPYVLSIFFVGVSLYIRIALAESPLFQSLKRAGKSSVRPIKDALGSWKNLRVVLLVLFGATAGQGAVWYTGHFYALLFLENVLKLEFFTSTMIVAVALVPAMPLFVLFGALSDRIGRLKVMMAGNLLAAVTYFPIYRAMHAFANPLNVPMLILLVFVLLVFVAMVYGPIAAFLVEAFPAKIRYTSLSLPYHLGNGWFGGTLPLIATTLVAKTGNMYAGLIFPIGTALTTFLVGSLFLSERRDVKIWDEVRGLTAPAANDR